MNTILIFSPQWRKDTKYNFFVVSFLFFFLFPQVKDTTSVNKLDEVLVSAILSYNKNAGQL
jgi:hypothetical protein